MYKNEKLFEKVEGFINTGSETTRLKALVEDIDNVNKNLTQDMVELFIDFDNVGNDGSEFDPYGTFSIKMKDISSEEKFESICGELSLNELDNVCCALSLLFEEKENFLKPHIEKLKENNIKLEKFIEEKYKEENKIVFRELDRYAMCDIKKFSEQDIDGQLYDLNRGEEVIKSFINSDWSKFNQRWINDIALIKLLKYYYNKCIDLEHQISNIEDKSLTEKIVNS